MQLGILLREERLFLLKIQAEEERNETKQAFDDKNKPV